MGRVRKRVITHRKVCPVCGSVFYTTYACKKYCGYQCYCDSKHKRKDVVSHKTEIVSVKSVMIPKRRCHDCGRPTYNYRCDRCWEKIRKEEY